MSAHDQQEILAHHEQAAQMWGQGGAGYDRISFIVSDALAHAAQRLNAGPGEEVLDVATGTGWSARNVTAMGAHVTAVDIAPELLTAARELSAHVHPPIDFRRGDAEALPFPDARFDGVISTFGVMFASDHHRAARELARVCRPGGRLAVLAWDPKGAEGQFSEVMGKHSPAPPREPSPFAWGDPDHAQSLLEKEFELQFERGISRCYFDDAEDVWTLLMQGFGPVRALAENLSPDAHAAMRRDFDAFINRFATEAGLRYEAEYLLILGRRRPDSGS